MHYLLLMYLGEAWNQLSLAARQQIYGEQQRLAHQLTASGQYRGGAPLHPPSTATSVRVRDGTPLVTAGPGRVGQGAVLAPAHSGQTGQPIAVLASGAGRIARGRTAPWRSC